VKNLPLFVCGQNNSLDTLAMAKYEDRIVLIDKVRASFPYLLNSLIDLDIDEVLN
jgi:hypothetical protein